MPSFPSQEHKESQDSLIEDDACEGWISWDRAAARNKAMNMTQGSISVCDICEERIETWAEGVGRKKRTLSVHCFLSHDKFDTHQM